MIDHVTVAFPDQYGRLWSTNINAEHFIHQTSEEIHFQFSYNPFNKDLLGADIEMPDSLEFEKSLRLKPDLDTLRQSAIARSGAFVIADPVDVPYAPRKVLRDRLSSLDINPQIEMSLTVGMTKFK